MNNDIETAIGAYKFVNPNATEESILSYLRTEGFSNEQIKVYIDLQSNDLKVDACEDIPDLDVPFEFPDEIKDELV